MDRGASNRWKRFLNGRLGESDQLRPSHKQQVKLSSLDHQAVLSVSFFVALALFRFSLKSYGTVSSNRVIWSGPCLVFGDAARTETGTVEGVGFGCAFPYVIIFKKGSNKCEEFQKNTPSKPSLVQGSGAKFRICNTVRELDLHRWHEASNLIFYRLWLRGDGRVSEDKG